MLDLKMLSQNARGLRKVKKRKKVFNVLAKKAQIVFLQETHSKQSDEKQWSRPWPGQIIFSHGSTHSRGVAIMIKDDLVFTKGDCLVDENGRYIFLRLKIEDKEYVIINRYAPNEKGEHRDFFAEIGDKLDEFKQESDNHIIIGGDLNIIRNLSLDRQGGNPEYWVESNQLINDMCDKQDLIDIWGVKNPLKKLYTWRRENPQIIQSRLDYWLVSDCLQTTVENVDMVPGVDTDHSAIFLHMRSEDYEKSGPAYWRLNVSLLNDIEYVELMNVVIPQILEEIKMMEYMTQWEFLKYKCKQITMKFGKEKARLRRSQQRELETKIQALEHNIALNPNEEEYTNLRNAKQELDEIYNYQIEGIMMRSQEKYYEMGEKNTKYFLNLETKNKRKSTITQLRDGQNIQKDPGEILKLIKTFYSDLYEEKGVDLSSPAAASLFNNDIPKLSEEAKHACEGPITENELFNTLKTFPKGKTPGNDGLPSEFYLTFWELFSAMFTAVVTEIYERGEMTVSQRQSVIKLLEKGGKDKLELGNWRPISLINVDAKLISKCISLRLKTVLPDIIHENQVGYVEGRNIDEGILMLKNMMEHTRVNQLPGLLLAIDFKKAFDSVNWEYMNKALEVFNFGETVTKWVKIMYTNMQSCVMNNGFSTGYFNLGRGVKQGDPLSPYLFIIALELLAIQIRNTKSIKGIQVETENKLSIYADDMTSSLQDIESAQILLHLLDDFGQISGLQVNQQKTQAMWIGSNLNRKDSPLNLDWTTCLKITGIYFTYDRQQEIQLNLKRPMEKVRQVFNMWKQRNLSLIGRIQIIKTFAVSQFLFVTNVIMVPEEIIKEIDKMLYTYIWQSSEKIKRSVMNKSVEEGGLNVHDMKTKIRTQRIMWIKRLLNNKQHAWKELPRMYLSRIGGIHILNGEIDIQMAKKHVSEFYCEMLDAWKRLNNYKPIGKQCLWCNTNIKIAGIFSSICRKWY